MIDELSIEAENDVDARGLFGVDDSVRPVFTDIHLHVNMSGPETQERDEKLARVVGTRCPVQDLLVNLTPVSAVVVED